MYILREKIETGGENPTTRTNKDEKEKKNRKKKIIYISYFMANFGFTSVINEHCSGHRKPLK